MFTLPKFVQCLIFFGLTYQATAQTAPTEFPKEFICHLKLSTGLISRQSAPEYFVGTISVVPQYTIVPAKLRGGAVIGASYAARKGEFLIGPTLSYKLAEFKGGYFGSLGNLHLNLEHLWSTGKQKLLGGGLNLDLLNKIVVGASAHRDYHFDNWWFGTSVAFRISSVKKSGETFPK